jgi:hypothetical protein
LGEIWFHVLRTLVSYATQPNTGGLTPSDLPLVDLTQDEIESIEALFQSTGLQEGF